MSGALASLGFTAPWLLWGLVLLPILWFILRVVPPAPILRRFPGVVLLLGLADKDSASARTPWWLLLLRVLALAAAIVGFAGPVLNPRVSGGGSGPLLLVADASWADAAFWSATRERLAEVVAGAQRDGRPVAFVNLAETGQSEIVFADGAGLADHISALEPAAWEPSEARMKSVAGALPAGRFSTFWLSDGLDRPGKAALAGALAAHGPLIVRQAPAAPLAIRPPALRDGKVVTTVLRPVATGPQEVAVDAIGLDPAGTERDLARQTARFAAGQTGAEVVFDLPPEARNRITRLRLEGRESAGAVALGDDLLRRRRVALIEGASAREGLELLSPGRYLREALRPTADLVEGTIADTLKAAPQVIILADVGRISQPDRDALSDWVDEGGLLVRFAGPRLAAAISPDGVPDTLLPVQLRPGGRSVGGSMSWGEPRRIADFATDSPFAGLRVPAEVTVREQVLAEPGPDLSAHTIAALADGTPLVTRARVGEGQVVLFHVTANAEWSTLPLSELFVQMLDRLAISSTPGQDKNADLTGTVWTAERVMDAFGALAPAPAGLAGVRGEWIASRAPGPDMPPGLYHSDDRRRAVNVVTRDRTLAPAVWPAGTAIEAAGTTPERPLGGGLLAAAMILLLVDGLATLVLSGLTRRSRGVAAALAVGLLLPLALPGGMRAQDAALLSDPDKLALVASGSALGYVVTGDRSVDETSRAGLFGLSLTLTQRTSVEPGDPIAVDLEKDDLSLFPFLYWPVTADMPAPSPVAYQKLNRFLQSGGLILFDTRDGDLGTAGGMTTPEGRRLQELAAPLDVPPLEPVPKDHVLTRSFYLLQDFPGRYAGAPVWVEAAPPDAEQAEGMPFRNLNDGVTPVVIGGNDWAAAWAVSDMGEPLFSVGRGVAGERQREMAYRFGVNLIMHVLTGNYKSDQVHVPALLERLGQ